MMTDDPSTTLRSLARVLESALFFFGVANAEQFEGLLDDAGQRAMLRNSAAATTATSTATGAFTTATTPAVVAFTA